MWEAYCCCVQDDKSFDVKYPRTVSSQEINNVAGQCLAVKVEYLHSMALGSEFYLGVIFANRVESREKGYTTQRPTYATDKYLEVKVLFCKLHPCMP